MMKETTNTDLVSNAVANSVKLDPVTQGKYSKPVLQRLGSRSAAGKSLAEFEDTTTRASAGPS